MKQKIKEIYSIIVKKIFDLIYSNLILANNDFFEKNVEIKKIYLNNTHEKSYNIYSIYNARIYSDNSENVAVIKKKYLLPNLSIQLGKNHLLEANENKILKTGTKKIIQKKIKGHVLSLVQGASAINNYGHWMLDILPKLCISEKLNNLNNFDAIYFPNFKKSFQIDSLKYFNLDRSKFIDGSIISHIYADKFTIPEHPYWKTNQYQMDTVANVDPEIIKILKNKFSSDIINNNSAKKLFIDRSDSNFFHNQIENYEEINHILEKNNFKKIKLTELSFKDQISHFKNADIIIGAHGAGLCNTIFCKPNTKLIEISNTINKCKVFENISKINNLNYSKLISTKQPPKNRIYPDIYVSTSELVKLI